MLASLSCSSSVRCGTLYTPCLSSSYLCSAILCHKSSRYVRSIRPFSIRSPSWRETASWPLFERICFWRLFLTHSVLIILWTLQRSRLHLENSWEPIPSSSKTFHNWPFTCTSWYSCMMKPLWSFTLTRLSWFLSSFHVSPSSSLFSTSSCFRTTTLTHSWLRWSYSDEGAAWPRLKSQKIIRAQAINSNVRCPTR